MNKTDVFMKLKNDKIIAIIRNVAPDKLEKTLAALINGGITSIEITAGSDDFINGMKIANRIFGDKILLGAGTIIEPSICAMAIEAGAKYVITPNFNPDVIKTASRYGVLTLIGAYTATEISNAYAEGADVIKIFPLGENGASYVKAIKGPFPYIPILAAGGVNLSNAKSYLTAGADILGIGGNLVNTELINNDNFKEITNIAKSYVEIVNYPAASGGASV